MKRRKFIALTGGMVTLAGCSGSNEETTTATTTTVKTTTTTTEIPTTSTKETTTSRGDESGDLSNDEILEAFRVTLREQEYDIAKLRLNEPTSTVQLDYRSTATTQEELAEEIGGVAGAFAEGVNQGWDVYYVDVIILDMNGEEVANYYIETGWAKQYNNGEISQEEYFSKILETLIVLN